MLATSFTRRLVSVSRRQSVRGFAKRYPHKTREEAFFPGIVHRYNAEDQNMFLAVFIYGSLIALGSWALGGKKPEMEESKGTTEGIPSIDDPSWPEWIAGNNGANVEAFFNNLAE